MKRKTSKSVILFIIISLTVYAAYYVSAHLLQLALIQGDSMLPAYHNMQLVMIDKQCREPQREEVILFLCDELDAVLIKRVVAVPGDVLTVQDGKLEINGVATDIPWKAEEDINITLSADEYFVVGDNYDASIDSRSDKVGIITGTDIIGKVY